MDWKEEYRNALLDTSDNQPDIREIIKPYIPTKLYKYGNFESQYWKKVIYKAQIYLAPSTSFNDPFDCRANFDYQKAISKGEFRNELVKSFREDDVDNLPIKMVEKIIERIRQNIFVSCFSEVWNSILMWAHYARNYNGYCIEYEMKEIRDNVIYNLFPVLYEDKYIDVTNRLINGSKNVGIICSLTKAKEWGYENEWRIVESRAGSFYVRKALKAVYLGKNCSPIIKEDIVQWAKDNNKEVYIVEASKTRYELERHRIV